jgi:hypothetical protein
VEKPQALSDVADNLHDDLSTCVQGFISQKVISVVETKRNTRLVKQIETIGSAQLPCDLTYSDPLSMYSMTIIGSIPVMTAPMIVVMPVVILPTKEWVKIGVQLIQKRLKLTGMTKPGEKSHFIEMDSLWEQTLCDRPLVPGYRLWPSCSLPFLGSQYSIQYNIRKSIRRSPQSRPTNCMFQKAWFP